MRHPAGLKAVAVTVLAAALGTACTDDDLSLDEWRQRADAVCADYEERFAALGPFPEDPDEVEGRLRELRRLTDAQVDDLRAVGLPDERRAQAADLLEDLEQIVVALDGAVEAAAEGAAPRRALEDAADARAAANDAAGDLALEVCGQVVAPDDSPVAAAIFEALAADLSAEEARCITDEVLAEVSEEELLGLDAAQLHDLPPHIRESIFRAATRCVSPRRLAELRR